MNKHKLTAIMCLLFINLPLWAQTYSTACFEVVELKKGFFALNTSYKSDLVNWYQSVFGMEVVKEFTATDGESFGIILKKNGQIVEIIHSKGISKADIAYRVEQSSENAGFRKIGIYAEVDLVDLKTCLESAGISAGRIYHDKDLKIKLLHLIDPEGNQLEIVGPE